MILLNRALRSPALTRSHVYCWRFIPGSLSLLTSNTRGEILLSSCSRLLSYHQVHGSKQLLPPTSNQAVGGKG